MSFANAIGSLHEEVPCRRLLAGRPEWSLAVVARRRREESPDTSGQRAARKRGGSWRKPESRKVSQKTYHRPRKRAARVKRRGKSPPLRPQGRRHDKPHAVQDRTGGMARPGRLFGTAQAETKG